MVEFDYEDHLVRLRRDYVEANPKQRLGVARQRIRNPKHDPNRLIAFVSAVEGFARCLAMRCHAASKAELSAVYPSYRNKGAEELIEEFLAVRALGSAADFFGAATWKRFGYAVQYRNLLAHECTYLGQDLSPKLIEACRIVLESLAKTQGLALDEA